MKQIIVALAFTVVMYSAAVFAQNPRAFITDSKSWEIAGGGGGTSGGFGGGVSGGARPQTAEIIKTFGEKCPKVTINNKQDKADYVVLLDHEGGKGWVRKDNKVAVFNWDGDSIVSHSTRSLGGSVEDACNAILMDWAANSSKRHAKDAESASTPETNKGTKQPEMEGKLSIASNPSGADIEVDGSFVGNTPSAVKLSLGEHEIAVKKGGYKDWKRTMKVTGGEINLSPELEKVQ